jgi:hypothetical protein
MSFFKPVVLQARRGLSKREKVMTIFGHVVVKPFLMKVRWTPRDLKTWNYYTKYYDTNRKKSHTIGVEKNVI